MAGQEGLADLFASGEGVEQDKAEAVRWWRKAAEQGDTMVQLRLGGAYERGEGAPRDYAEAARWYRKAAEGRDVAAGAAQALLARAYRTGRGVPKSYAQAGQWYLVLIARSGVRCSRRLSWLTPIALMMAVSALAVPKRRWGRAAGWGPWALMAGSSAVSLYHGATSGSSCFGLWGALLMAGLGVYSAVGAVTEFVAGARERKSIATART